MNRRRSRLRPSSLLVPALLSLAAAGTASGRAVGDVVITEIMVAPPTDGSAYREWFEVYVVNSVDLEECWIVRSPTGDPDDYDERMEIDGVHTVWADQHLLFARDEEYVVGEEGDEDARGAVFTYDYFLSFSNIDPFFLMLVCDDQIMDAIPMEWSLFADDCEGNGCAVALRPERTSVEANDELPGSWCLPPDELTFVNSAGDVATGTPGEPNRCRVDARPEPGDVVFHEVMIAAGHSGQWLEFRNLADHAVLLQDCLLRRWRAADPTDADSTVLTAAEGPPLILEAGEIRVFSTPGCLDAPQDDPTGGECLYDEVLYEGIELADDVQESLELACPPGGAAGGDEITVDTITYDLAAHGAGSRYSMQFVGGDLDAAAVDNDRWTDWCPASTAQCFHKYSGGVCDFGTPGRANECLVPPEDEGGGGCDCALDGARARIAPILLAAWFAAAAWRRRREGRR